MKNIIVIFGGSSVEHDVSIVTGMQLSKVMSEKYSVKKIYLNLDNRFFDASKIDDVSYFNDKTAINLKEIYFFNKAVYQVGLIKKKLYNVDTIVNCCHGGVGENGDLAGFFAVLGIKMTSTDSLSAHITMNKSITKELLKDDLPVVKGVLVDKTNFDTQCEIIDKEFSKNLIVKPNSLGSSIGVKVADKSNYREQIKAIFEMNDFALVEERIVDLSEYNEACFIGKDGLILSAIEQPLTKNNVLTFEDKYVHEGKTKMKDREIPAKISKELESQIKEYTKIVYEKLNLSGVVRVDYIYDKANNKLYFNEVNTIPGSMAFYLYEAVGLDYISIVEELIDNATLKKYSYFNSGLLRKNLI